MEKNILSTVWNILLHVRHFSPPSDISDLISPKEKRYAHKVYGIIEDKKEAAKHLHENKRLYTQYSEELQYVRYQLEQRLSLLERQLGQDSPSRQLQNRTELEAIEADCALIKEQEERANLAFEAWVSSHAACEAPRKEYTHAMKEFAYRKELFIQAWKLHSSSSPEHQEKAKEQMDFFKQEMRSTELAMDGAQKKLIVAEDAARQFEKDFEKAAAASWPVWQSDAASITTQMLEAA